MFSADSKGDRVKNKGELLGDTEIEIEGGRAHFGEERELQKASAWLGDESLEARRATRPRACLLRTKLACCALLTRCPPYLPPLSRRDWAAQSRPAGGARSRAARAAGTSSP